MKQLLLVLILIPSVSFSQIQIGQDIDGETAEDRSGHSISLSSDGNIVAISSVQNNNFSGHVRVYKNESGNWVQIGSDIDGTGGWFGYSVSLSSDGRIVAIGAVNSDANGLDSGHVSIYENQSNNWVQIGSNISGESFYDGSGISLSLSFNGSIVAIGARSNNGNGNASGHVRVYKYQNNVWTQLGGDIDGEAAGDWSGHSVSLSSDGSIVAIGAIHNDAYGLHSGTNPGHVRVYRNISGNWVQIGSDIDGENLFDRSGWSVSLSSDGSIIAIGAEQNDGNGYNSGHVRIYKNESGNWVQVGSDIDGQLERDHFGYSISLSSEGNLIAIGGTYDNPIWNGSSGIVRIYKNESDNWVQIGPDIHGEAEYDLSGRSVGLSSNGSIVAIGATGNDNANGIRSGHVRVFSIEVLLEVIEDITGNNNEVNITANQLNSINGVSGAIEGINYSIALDNGIFINEYNPTASEIQTIIDQVNLNITENDIFSFNFYPNPAKNQFTIQLNTTAELRNASIYNNLGQLVLTSKETTINSSKLAAGLYVVQIETNKGKGSKKLIIE
ncbi:T9SS type A sorting domain-containing protein [uncultured Winogradskyella sp.]|uniref:T9SS type A sorting domain-containing protein n=1 Tax=uncultured Winogradskyella sp. TaxID=395353 RepID=UPI0026191DFF|nr:T9SS type A sorting domain-containing protein [uncultured Winogradskyella sp.]